jgi:tetratricopeptide (TPR) repeat protein
VEFKRGIEFAAGEASAHQFYGIHLAFIGHHQAAERQIDRALELDPFSLSLRADAGWMYYLARRYDVAIEQLQRAHRLGFAYEQNGMLEEAIAQFEVLSRFSGGKPRPQSWLAHAYARAGRTREAELIAQSLIVEREKAELRSSIIALVFLGLGRSGEAIDWLKTAYMEHDPNLIPLLVDPVCDTCCSDPHFMDLLSRVGLRAR